MLGVHLISEAERLAYADRDRYVADTDFVPLPGGSPDTLLGSRLPRRSRSADLDRPHDGYRPAGPSSAPPAAPVAQPPEHGTSHISVVDAAGNAASLTTTIESPFGSFHMVDGFLLNNQLTDFAAEPVGPDATPVANRVAPGKRPRSTMAPTLVFDTAPSGARGALYAVTGSPGGSTIIQFVVKTIVGVLDWGLDPQQAVSMVDFGAANSATTNVGGEHPLIDTADDGAHDPLVQGLRRLGIRSIWPSRTAACRPSCGMARAGSGVPTRGARAPSWAMSVDLLVAPEQFAHLIHRLDRPRLVDGLDRHHRNVLVVGQVQPRPPRAGMERHPRTSLHGNRR